MYEFAIDTNAPKSDMYRELVKSADALTSGESDGVANMSNIAALLWEFLPDVNWTGFYRVVDGELVLGPFQGKAACIRIPFGRGVCGAAAQTGETQLVEDVHAFPGHIACAASTRSELVLPVRNAAGQLLGVFDIDSDLPDAFSQTDAEELQSILDQVFAEAE